MPEVRVINKKNPKLREEFLIYTQKEADAEGMKYVPWHETKEGEYGLTDDGYVSVCRKVYHAKDGGRIHNFPLGRGMVNHGGKPSKLIKDAPPKHWADGETGRSRTKRAVKLYCNQLLGGKIDWDGVGRAYRPDVEIPAATAKRLFKQEVIQKMVDTELRKMIKDLGVNEEFVLNVMKKAIQIAEAKGDPGNMLKGASELSDLLSMKPKKTTVSDTLQIDMTKEISGKIEKHAGSLKLTEKREEDGLQEVLPVSDTEG